jgi:hypothetical protein
MIANRLTTALCAAFAAAAVAPAVAQPPAAPGAGIPSQNLPLDRGIEIAGVQVACTGMGQTRDDPRWAAYPVRVEFAGAHADYVADEHVLLTTARGKPLFRAYCAAPWVLLKPPPGAYAIQGWLPNSAATPRSGSFTVPDKGQKRLTLTFPDAH